MTFSYADNCLSFTSEGSYHAAQPLANITVTGLEGSPNGQHRKRSGVPRDKPQHVFCNFGGKNQDSSDLETSYDGDVLKVSGTEDMTKGGAFEQDLKLCFEW